jgi:hypothetical protein
MTNNIGRLYKGSLLEIWMEDYWYYRQPKATNAPTGPRVNQ